MKTRTLMLAVSVAALAVAGCGKKSESQTASQTDQPAAAASAASASEADPWPDFMATFLDKYFAFNPTFAVYQGKHEFDGNLPDWSADGVAANIDFRKKAIADARAIDASKLSDAEKFERDYMTRVMDGEVFWLETADWPHKNPAFYVGSLDPSPYLMRPYADKATRMKAFIKYLQNVPAAAVQIKQNLQLPLPATYLKYGQAGFDGFADFYTTGGKEAFADVDDPELQSELDAAATAASAAMKDLSDHLGTVDATPDGFALGADKFSAMLKRTEDVDISLDDLEAAGRADLKRNQDALNSACEAYAPGETMAACMLKMQSNKPVDGPVEAARKQLPTLEAFVRAKDLVSIPGEEQALVEESPPYNRQNSAYIDPPGPYDKGIPSVYYISPPDPSWDEATRAAYIPGKDDLLFTSVHEVWPGHFLQFLHANRVKSIFGRLFVGYAFAEGWAHYTEEMVVEAGLNDGDPETKIGQISNALLRDCRFLSAIGLHAKGMTVEQSDNLFRTECYQDAGTAKQQAARGTYDPAYLNYTMGKLMIRKLRADWLAKHYPDGGGREGWKEFHDDFLSYGGPPIPLVRQQMMGDDEAKAVF
ncbi:MAG: DUF885 domain-containing protein [Parvularculaceae bacterium]